MTLSSTLQPAARGPSTEGAQSAAPVRTCACGKHLTPGGGECEQCRRARQATLHRSALSSRPPAAGIPPVVRGVLATSGEPLAAATKQTMEAHFGHDFSHVRVHADRRAAESARAVDARAYTVGSHIAFGRDRYAPDSTSGRRLLAHELTHVVQQGEASASSGAQPPTAAHEHEADRAAETVAAGLGARPALRSRPSMQRAGEPFIKKVTVHLAPPQNAALEWEGTPPSDAPGNDAFTVSTGKGYSDPDDPPRTCTRTCCSDAAKQCAPPWNEPGKIGACCTYIGTGFWTGTPEDEHGGPGGWKYWTPIQPNYANRAIALHQHPEVTGKPIGHGCVRMAEGNAHRIAKFSRGRRTRVDIDGRAAPVLCEPDRQCGATGSLEQGPGETRLAAAEQTAVPGLEGEMS